MKNFIVCLFVAGLTFALGWFLYLESPPGTSETEVLSLMNEFHQAIINKDRQKMQDIISDDIAISLNKIESGTKEQLLSNVDNMDTESINSYLVFTDVKSDEVTVSFEMEMTFKSKDEYPSIHNGHYTYKFTKRQNRWKLTGIDLKR